MSAHVHRPPRFLVKIALALALVFAADQLFYWQVIGSTIGGFMLAVTLAIITTNQAAIRDRRARTALVAAAVFGMLLVENPTFLGFALICGALWMAALLPRYHQFDDAARWLARIGLAVALFCERPINDVIKLSKIAVRRGLPGPSVSAQVLIMPLLGSLVFGALFTLANPIIANAVTGIDPSLWFANASPVRFAFWVIILLFVWTWLRPAVSAPISSRRQTRIHLPETRDHRATIILSLAAFNLVFAVQNGLDLIFLWSGAALPAGVTLADYAHQGAYPLIATALLAGLFVIVALQPGSGLEANKRVRALVYFWVTQNILLVASSILRTLDYIEVYSLTQLRVAALIWMALVGIGLALICLRIVLRWSGAWLINANSIAALSVLTGCTVIDLGEVTARWNIAHNLEVSGTGVLLDRVYLAELGASALTPLDEAIASQPRDAVYAQKLREVHNQIFIRLEAQQADWHGWTWRNARRLAHSQQFVDPARQQALTGGVIQ